mmetsp:Transcript_19636/g.48864  ORF Transcript_19636/g.48864 Transcript_19636/m.48864 type:complete len:408 (+) Transcript_19636:183-1406(+)|eukprot:CAMPEP_0116077916 /NCGR_PEP_ID=MMETSP0327-20121206/325_1 /TAXON_ID=44447 /ORGANISM="Pseudo-nitzschia delicatissima, Strain B596" /LENGTH=407 /DNA_ID=CAMNT_0003568429 /DNA_START=54 /DNA_END=1277 /DNA_ORIENTATION=-
MASKECSSSTTPRRSLFPKSYAKKGTKKGRNVSFSPYARCLKLESQNLTDEEKSKMWWQKSDYEDFARVGKIISKAMLEGGSEIWLRSKSSPLSPTKSGTEEGGESYDDSPAITKDDCMIESSSTVGNLPLHHDFIAVSSSQEFCQISNKWWHKFDHSRRGLEHITSNAEGRQRHLNGRSAIQSVIEEQQRQMMFLPKGYADVDKIRAAYLQQTQWARILARAAGESDADAVQTNFDESRRKPREYYLKKHFENNRDYLSTNIEIRLPVFMEDTISSKRSNKITNLDANTASQICFRNSQVVPMSSKLQKQKKKNRKSEGKEKAKASKKSANRGPSSLCEEKKSEDDDTKNREDANNSDDTSSSSSEDSSSSLAKMAAGWGVDEVHESMSSVLIGMGISTKPKITVG